MNTVNRPKWIFQLSRIFFLINVISFFRGKLYQRAPLQTIWHNQIKIFLSNYYTTYIKVCSLFTVLEQEYHSMTLDSIFLLTTIITLLSFRMFTIKKKTFLTFLTQLINSTVNLKDLMQEYCQTTCNIAFKSNMSSDIGC